MGRCVALFAKRPEAGKVKTRLQSACSPSEAAHLYRAFLLDTATTVSAAWAEEKVIAYAPTGAEEFLRDLLCEAGSFTYVAQRDGTLGERMQDVIDGALGRGAERVVLLGSDSPDLPAEYINRAFDLLVEHSLVEHRWRILPDWLAARCALSNGGYRLEHGRRARPDAGGHWRAIARPAAGLVRRGYAAGSRLSPRSFACPAVGRNGGGPLQPARVRADGATLSIVGATHCSLRPFTCP